MHNSFSQVSFSVIPKITETWIIVKLRFELDKIASSPNINIVALLSNLIIYFPSWEYIKAEAVMITY